ncbi:MAG: Ig-like domain repeat protein [Candidatus Bathyarchaeia archaeon]
MLVWRKEMRRRKATIIIFITILTLTLSLSQTFTAEACHRGDRKPPKIHYVYQYPIKPEYEDSVLILAYITDSKSGVANATLCYRVNGQEVVRLKMNRTGNLFFAKIPPKRYNSTVAYVVCAYDRAGNKACSKEYLYVVGDFHPPVITYVERVPAQPNYNETALIIANATEPSLASGVKELLLSYNNGTDWNVIKMDFNGTLYFAEIPTLQYGTTVNYHVSAVDNAGNTATLDIYLYVVGDRFPPIATILTPNDGSYVAGNINVTVHVHDDNLLDAKLMVNETLLAEWNMTGQYAFQLDTATLDDGLHILTLEALDMAGNIAKHEVTITVDNTLPKAEILSPLNGSFLRGIVLVKLHAEDANFDRIELEIGEEIHVWGIEDQTYVWDASGYGDGVYNINLTVFDMAGNKNETGITVIVDNTAPTVTGFVWTPTEPTENKSVKVSAQIVESGSGIKNVTLWFRLLGGEWQKLPMDLEGGNWTGTIPGYLKGAIMTFYVECFDNAGNTAKTVEGYYVVKAAPGEEGAVPSAEGFPLYWLILIILAIFAVLASTTYYVRKRKRGATSNYFAITSL